jgi:hypothetical protein
MHVQASHWLHAKSIPETSSHQFWLELIPLPKSVGTYSSLYALDGECLPSSTFFLFFIGSSPKKRLKIRRLSKIEVPMGKMKRLPPLAHLFIYFPNHGASCHTLVSLESHQRIEVHQIGFIICQLTLDKLLNIEQCFH